MPLQQLDTDLWIASTPHRFMGVDFGARMTVVRLSDGRLWVHSPLPARPELFADVLALGPVVWLVAPNRLHHLYIGDWHRELPDAEVHVAPGLETKRPDLAVTGVLGDAVAPGWAQALEPLPLEGMPAANEFVFFHGASATLIVSDLVFNLDASSPPLTRLVFRLIGSPGELAPTLVEKLLIRDRAAFRRSLERILEWPFERVVMAHGSVWQHGGREALARGYAWLLDRRGAARAGPGGPPRDVG